MKPDTEKGASLPYPTDAAPEGFAEEVLNLKDFEFDTPDTEWEKEFEEKKKQWIQYDGFCYQDGEYSLDHIKKYISSLLTSRDTYWKERVREETIEDVKKKIATLKDRRHLNDLFFQDCPNCGELANEAFVADKFVEVWNDSLDAVLSTLNK